LAFRPLPFTLFPGKKTTAKGFSAMASSSPKKIHADRIQTWSPSLLKSLEAIVCMLTAVLVEARSKAAAHTFSLE
jgi:hypothetical protein